MKLMRIFKSLMQLMTAAQRVHIFIVNLYSLYIIIVSDDFQSASGTLTLSSDTSESCFDDMIVDDDIREAVPECFTVSILSSTGDIGSPSVATVCISDNDGTFYTYHS